MSGRRRQNLLLVTMILVIVATSGYWSTPAVRAQTAPRLGSEANPADLLNPFTYGLNPAVGEMTLPQIAVGFEMLHTGLLNSAADLNTGGLIYTTRRPYGGFSFAINYLDTPLWGVRQLQAGYGRRVWKGLSLGANLGLNQRGFDKDKLDLSQGSTVDPLLAGSLKRTVPVMTLAATYSLPLEGLTVAALLENFHEPNISIDGNDSSVFLPSTTRLGVGWEQESFQVTAGLVNDYLRTRLQLAGRGMLPGGHGLQARFSTDQWSLAARVRVSKKAWLQYVFTQSRSELSSVTSGSHGVVLCLHRAGRAQPPVIYSHQPVPDQIYDPGLTDGPVRVPTPRSVPVVRPAVSDVHFSAAARVDTALIRVKRIKRVFNPDVDMAQVRRLPRWRIGVLDSTWSDRVTWDITADMTTADPESELPRGNYSEQYQQGMEALQQGLAVEPGAGLVIAADPDQLDRARYLAARVGVDSLTAARVEIRQLAPLPDPELRRMLMQPVGPDSIPDLEEVTMLQYAAIPVFIQSLGDVSGIRNWSLEIRDSLDRPVRVISGPGGPPVVVSWNWRDGGGRVVDVDNYTYQLSWRDEAGTIGHTPQREILIARQVMQRTLEFGHDQTPLRSLQNARPVLILDPGREGLSVGAPATAAPDSGAVEINDSADEERKPSEGAEK